MFPRSYLESRDLFEAAANRLHARTYRYRLSGRCRAGPPLSTDVAILGNPAAERLLILSSGTHGVEGYAGAACQLRFMETYRQRYRRDGFACLLVHAVNPWGYFHDRRVTEEGIDLNRNFVDFEAILPVSGYADYHALLVSDYRPLPRGVWNRIRLLGLLAGQNQRRRLQAAVTAGQYTHADGLFFGGHAPAASRLAWERILADHAAAARKLVLADIHTGLGRYGDAEVMSTRAATSAQFQRLNRWMQGAVRSMNDGASVSPPLEGTLTAAFIRMFDNRGDAFGIEFGTLPPLSVLHALRADQWTWNLNDSVSPLQRQAARSAMKQAFAPADPRWQQMTLAHFDQQMDALITGMNTNW